MAWGFVAVVEDGRVRSEHVFEPDDRDAMLARYAELSDYGAAASDPR